MKNRHQSLSPAIRLIILAFIALFITGLFFTSKAYHRPPLSTNAPTAVNISADFEPLEIHFLDVGQGLSLFAKCGSQTLLYDGGSSDYSSFVVSYLKEQQVESLDYLIASHYDADHIHGLIGALHVFDVNTIMGPNYTHDSDTYKSWNTTITQLQKEVTHPAVGDSYPLENAIITILSPETITEHANNNSLAIKITHGENSFIITGDAEHDSEAQILASNLSLACDVLVIGHHGSSSSTSWDFLQQTIPKYAIISCGADNDYGHPHKETMQKLETMNVEIFRTDKQGTIITTSNGTDLTWSASPVNDYSAGIRPTNSTDTESLPSAVSVTYTLNKNSKKIHHPSCSSVSKIAPKNYVESTATLEFLLSTGYSKCKNCMK